MINLYVKFNVTNGHSSYAKQVIVRTVADRQTFILLRLISKILE